MRSAGQYGVDPVEGALVEWGERTLVAVAR
jgi:hypothetical protein